MGVSVRPCARASVVTGLPRVPWIQLAPMSTGRLWATIGACLRAAAAFAEHPAQPVVAAFGDVIVAAHRRAVEPAGFDALGPAAQHQRATVHRPALTFGQAQRLGQELAARGVRFDAVYSSRWCRCR